MPRRHVVVMAALALLLAGWAWSERPVRASARQPPERGRTLHVRPPADGPADSGDGSSRRPFSSIDDAVALAQPGDAVVLAAGTYAEELGTVRGGSVDRPIVIRGADPAQRPLITAAGRVATISHPHVTVRDIVLDGQFGSADLVRVTSEATGLVLRSLELRRSSRDCLDMDAPADVTIEATLIHHCLDARDGRTDAHGIVAGAVWRLRIRDVEVHTFSGDALQVDPGRAEPGWSDVRVDGSRFWLQPLPEAVNGFPAGTVPGENGIDTKTPAEGARATLVVTNSSAWGFKDGLINNMAAFNLKERVDAIVDGVTVHHATHAFRVRGPGDAGARVTIRNSLVYDVDTAVRFEDDIDTVRVHNVTLGRGVATPFRRVSADRTQIDVRNLLLLGRALPRRLAGRGLAVGPRAFVDVDADDYRLRAGSPAIDRGERVDGLDVDRLGLARPQGAAPDVGAFEYAPVSADGESRRSPR